MLSASLLCSLSLVVPAQAHPLDKALADLPSPALQRAALGLTRKQTAIPYLYTADDLNAKTPRRRVLLVGGLDGSDESVQATLAALRWFHTDPAARPWRERVALSAVPCANPDGWAAGKGPGNGAGGNPLTGYPPQGDAYRSPTDPEAAYLWRFVGQFAPDLVVVVLPAKELGWAVPAVEVTLLDKLKEGLPARAAPRSALTVALTQSRPAGVAEVPALEALAPDGRFLRPLLEQLDRAGFRAPSPAGREMRRRLGRTPRDVAEALSEVYGRELKTVAYIPTVALVAGSASARCGRLRATAVPSSTSSSPTSRAASRPWRGHQRRQPGRPPRLRRAGPADEGPQIRPAWSRRRPTGRSTPTASRGRSFPATAR